MVMCKFSCSFLRATTLAASSTIPVNMISIFYESNEF
jgi:hypothetical protein